MMILCLKPRQQMSKNHVKKKSRIVLFLMMYRLSADDTRRGSITSLPCEFCHALQSSENLTHHQVDTSSNFFFCN
jgi:hypothetical protein